MYTVAKKHSFWLLINSYPPAVTVNDKAIQAFNSTSNNIKNIALSKLVIFFKECAS